MIKVDITNDVPVFKLSVAPRLAAAVGGFELRSFLREVGRVVKWEWDIGNTGTWKIGFGGDTVLVPAAPGGTVIPCKVRATDDDGNTAESSAEVIATKWRHHGPFSGAWQAMRGSAMTEADGFLYIMYEGVHFARYDPASGSLISLARIQGFSEGNSGVHSLASTAGKIYSVGPHALHEYDFANNVWKPRSAVYERGSLATMFQNRVYVVGGGNPGVHVRIYDPVLDSWVYRAPLPAPLIEFSMGEVAGKLYVTGGCHAVTRARNSITYEYDPLEDRWTEKAPMPLDVNSVGGAVAKGHLLVMGAMHAEKGRNRLYAYRAATNVWTEVSPPLFPVITNMPPAVDGILYGIGEGGNLESYDPSQDLP